jgi:hypothetical protein
MKLVRVLLGLVILSIKDVDCSMAPSHKASGTVPSQGKFAGLAGGQNKRGGIVGPYP